MSMLQKLRYAALSAALFACAEPDATAPEQPDLDPLALQTGAGSARNGSWSVAAKLSRTPSWLKLIHYDSPVKKNTRHTASIWVKGSGKLRLDVVNKSWRENLGSVAITATATWQRFTIPDFDTGDNDVVHYNVYDALGGTAGTVYLDDAFFGQVGGPNLLSNPGFEAGLQDWLTEGVFSIVRDAGGSPPPPPDARPDQPVSGSARTGSWFATATIARTPSWTKIIHYDSPVSKQTRYSASIWAKGSGRLRLDVVNKDWRGNLASVIINATPTWQRYAVPDFDTGDNDVVHYNAYDGVGGAAGTVYLDDASLGLVGGPNLLSNPSFEAGPQNWIIDGVFRIQAGDSGTTPVDVPRDRDGDGVPDARDNCPTFVNPGQEDADGDRIGTACDESEVTDEPGPNPEGTYFAEVEANGTGCPKDTWNTRISRDGLVFTTTFSAYETRLDPITTLSVRDCQLAIKLHTPGGRSFSVQSFSYSGYAILQPGVTGRQLASYYFQGQTVQAKAHREDLTGPYDSEFLFKDDVALKDAVWSPCGVERDLNITTRILLETATPGASGYMNLTAADGSARMVLQLASRPCNQFGTVR